MISDWVQQYGDDLYSWAYHKTSDEDQAQDLVQDTFLSAFKSIEKFKGKSNPKTWLLSILNNKIIDHYRNPATASLSLESITEQQGMLLTDSMFDQDGSWSEQKINPLWADEGSLLDDIDFSATLAGCINDLPGNWKTMVVAKYQFEKDSHEICDELSISLSNYWQILHRAKLMLKKCIELHWFKK